MAPEEQKVMLQAIQTGVSTLGFVAAIVQLQRVYKQAKANYEWNRRTKAFEQTDPSGLIYMQARFYLPMYGRFASPDPARDQHFEQTQSWNIYSYVQNNPTMMIDPTGMFE